MRNITQYTRTGMAWLFLCSTIICMADVQIDARLDRVIAPIVTNGDDVILAASFEYGTYGADGMSSNDSARVFRDVPEETALEHPEYIVFKTYQHLRRGNARALYYDVMDPKYSRRKYPGGLKGYQKKIARSAKAVKYGEDVRLLAKSRFGPYVRIDHEVSAVIGSGPTIIPISLYYIQQDDRYYQTTEIRRTSLFGTLVDLATQGDKKAVDTPLRESDIESMQSLFVTADLELPPEKRNTDLRYVQGAEMADSERGVLSDLPDHYLGVYHTMEYLDWTISEENNPAALDKYQRFLLHVSRTYESRNEEEIVNLWREEERESERGSIDSLKEQSDWPQATGSFFTDQTKVLAIEETDFGVIVISERDNSRYALYLVENEKGVLKLSRYLGSSGYHRIFLNTEFLNQLVGQLREQGSALPR